MLDLDKALKAACGLDEDGFPKSLVSLLTMRVPVYVPEGEEAQIETIDTLGMDDAKVDIFPLTEQITQITLTFPDPDNMNMYDVWNALEKFTKDSIDFDNHGGDLMPALSLYIMPIDCADFGNEEEEKTELMEENSFYICANIPVMHCLTSEYMNRVPMSITMLFYSENVSFMEVDGRIDLSSVVDEVVDDLRYREAVEKVDEQKQEEIKREAERQEEITQKHIQW